MVISCLFARYEIGGRIFIHCGSKGGSASTANTPFPDSLCQAGQRDGLGLGPDVDFLLVGPGGGLGRMDPARNAGSSSPRAGVVDGPAEHLRWVEAGGHEFLSVGSWIMTRDVL